MDWGMSRRMADIVRPPGRRAVMLAVDHGYFLGPTERLESPARAVRPLVEHCDSLMLTRGVLRACVPPSSRVPVVLRASGGPSIIGEDLSDERITVGIRDALRLGASALAVSVFVGSKHERQTVVGLGRLVDEAEEFGVPVLAVTAVGKDMARDARYLSLACRMAAEQGARIVKTYYCEGFERVVESCPVPVIIAGGKKIGEREALELTASAVHAGAVGVDMGRNIWQSDHPVAMIRAVRSIVHGKSTAAEAHSLYGELARQEPAGPRSGGARGRQRQQGGRPQGQRDRQERGGPQQQRAGQQGGRPQQQRAGQQGGRPQGQQQGQRDRQQGGRPQGQQQGQRDRQQGGRPQGQQQGGRPQQQRAGQQGGRPQQQRAGQQGGRPQGQQQGQQQKAVPQDKPRHKEGQGQERPSTQAEEPRQEEPRPSPQEGPKEEAQGGRAEQGGGEAQKTSEKDQGGGGAQADAAKSEGQEQEGGGAQADAAKSEGQEQEGGGAQADVAKSEGQEQEGGGAQADVAKSEGQEQEGGGAQGTGGGDRPQS